MNEDINHQNIPIINAPLYIESKVMITRRT